MRHITIEHKYYIMVYRHIIACFWLFYSAFALSNPQMNQIVSQEPSPKVSVDFDVDLLKSLGYGAEIAEFFKQGSQFLPGQHDVTLHVNGNASYATVVTIGEQGQLCTNVHLQQTLKLKSAPIQGECIPLESLYTGAKVTTHPNDFSIDVLLPETAFDPALRGESLTQGGTALLANYRIYGMRMHNHYGNAAFYQGEFETGINWNNWVLRNNSSLSSGKNHTQYQFNETTVSRSISALASRLQFGQINTQGSLFAGIPLLGGQLYSDSALQEANRLIVPITGVAQSPSTVEVKQNGRLIYRTLVPAGPFYLDRINNVISSQPLDISVIQDNGQQQHFSVTTAINRNPNTISAVNYQTALGRYRKYHRDNNINNAWIASLEGSFNHGVTSYQGGLLVSKDYQSIASHINTTLDHHNTFSAGLGLTASRNHNAQGIQIETSLSQSLDRLSIGLSTLYRTKQYPTLEESMRRNTEQVNDSGNTDNEMMHTSTSASASWSHKTLGRISYSINYIRYYGHHQHNIFHTINYGKKLGNITFNLSYQTGNHRDNRLYLSASLPLTTQTSISTQWQRYRQLSSVSSTVNHRPNNTLNYYVGANRSPHQEQVNGGINLTTAYSQLAANGAWSKQNTSVMLSATGALVYADGMLATSPVVLGDTFGILQVPKYAGIKVSSMGGGNSTTNHFGIAVIPTLPAQRKTTVQLDTQNLPLNVRLETTAFDVAVARGTVISRKINATEMKQLLLGITLQNGLPAPSGASVLNDKGQLVSVVMNNGYVMLSNEQISQPIHLHMFNQPDCMINYLAPEHFNLDHLYEETKAICLVM